MKNTLPSNTPTSAFLTPDLPEPISPAPALSLSKDQIIQYYQKGYVVLREALDAETVRFAGKLIDDTILNFRRFPERVLWEKDGLKGRTPEELPTEELVPSARRVHWEKYRDEGFMRFAAHPRLVSALVALLGNDIQVLQDMALIKPPLIGTEKPLHQDAAYFEVEPHDQTVGVWMALDPATVENGCMHVWPGTHRMPLVHHRDIENTPHKVIEELDASQKGLAVPMNPGDALLFSSHLFHFTPPNRSTTRRRSIQVHYASSQCRLAPGRKARFYTLIHGQSIPGCI